MSRFALPVAMSALLLLCATPLLGGVVFPTNQNIILEDDDWEIGISNKVGEPAKLEAGDVLVAMFEVQRIKDQSNNVLVTFQPTTQALTGIVVLQVAAAKVSGGTADYLMRPYTGSWSDLSLGLENLGLNDAHSSNSVLALYDDPVSSPGPHVNPGILDGSSNPDFSASFDTAEQGTLLWEFGYAGGFDDGDVPPLNDPNELWTAETRDIDASPDPQDITKIDFLAFDASLNLTYTGSGAPLAKVSKSILDWYTPDSSVPVTSDFIVNGARDTELPVGNFPLGTDTDALMEVVPEPWSFVVWSVLLLLFAGLGAVRARRR